MTNGITITATSTDGKTLSALAELIKVRQKALKETTADAVTATALNVLTSLRAATKVAKPEAAKKYGYTVTERPDLVPGFARGRRCVRERGGHSLTGVKTVNLAGSYAKGEQVKVYILLMSLGKLAANKDLQWERRYVIAKSPDEVKKWAMEYRRKRIETYAGMAKWAVGQTARKVYLNFKGGAEDGANVTAKAKALASRLLKVTVINDGLGNGRCAVTVEDGINYSADALKGGAAAVETALQKAANKTAGLINQAYVNKRFDEHVETPFPEIKVKR